ncbi:wax ester/triacylglycerol synthase family O-acyltransferase [Mycobacterium koreense]|uniref:Diacylglycerol O-acyltransferase n=1 Tax=Mycolicibacillus koreensis TaxID=1069220 RepID=A0A7I7SI02_9MYCO|nr:wax ester/triacylglycerol synthase family O-acyltransferase [Mycolicibacillus koreensis]MCV7248663.1 wax ester/triacylglycerol synthase family O-acyltransferase [Mycolicibacillus koreensis]OSC31171.1 wax ester/triacylglycerol synthase family O-acyltransferase [Mycolicibacillus koreensis]BBY55625.1 diacylglycerol O-acyltransferase [Mycolicibacillus koreensis]
MKRLSGWDAVLLYSETDNVHMHTLKVAVIELDAERRGFTIEQFRKVLHGRLYKLEPFRFRLVDIPYKFHHPMWQENADVDLDYHVRPWRLPEPGGRRELDEAIGEIASTPLDRSRPLWEMYFIEGLANHRIAVVGKIHHALADGIASANLMAQGMDLQRGRQVERHDFPTEPAPTKGQLMRSAFRDHLRQLGRVPTTVRYTAAGLSRVRRSGRRLSPELTRPFSPPPTFMNHVLTPQRRFATATLSLADIKETSKKLGATLNDVVLAISTGALRNLLLHYDGSADRPLLASVPMGFDFSAERIWGNKFSGVLVGLPVDVEDPLQRVAEVHEAATEAKATNQLIGPELVNRWAAYFPPAGMEALFRRLASSEGQNKTLNLNISNVPGPREPGRVGGALVTEIYSVGPLTAGSGLNITVWSYVDQLNISVLADAATLKDPHEVTDAMVAEFIEIRRAAGLSEQLTAVPEAMAPVSAPTP